MEDFELMAVAGFESLRTAKAALDEGLINPGRFHFTCLCCILTVVASSYAVLCRRLR